jgi:hypothetical protein
MYTKVRKPNIQVLLHKVVTRTSATGNPSPATNQSTHIASTINVFDITGRLGEGSAVRVQKSVRDSSGAFSIDFVDKYVPRTEDTLYSFIEPMDMLEIRFAGDAYSYASSQGQKLPIMMRGFVSNIERSQSMGADGKPRRTVHVTGFDYHKILQLIQIFNMPATPEVANLISSFPLFSKYGQELNVQTTTQFLLQIFNLVVNPYIAGLMSAGGTTGATLAEIACDIQVPDAIVSVQLGAFNNGTVQQLLEQYLDIGPFNEFFIEDRDAGDWGPAGPYAVYRPAPFLGAVSRTPLQPIQTSVTTGIKTTSSLSPSANVVQVSSLSIVSLTERRSDAGVGNYFWVDAPRFNMNYDDLVKAFATYAAQPGSVPYYIQNYQNVNPLLYGLRKMEVTTEQGGVSETNNGNGQPAGAERWSNQGDFLGWINNRRNLLIALNQDNVVLEKGEMRLMGNALIRAGTYVQVDYGDKLKSLYYAHTVTHVYEPFGNYFTEIEYDRGTNFVDRITATQSNGSPYFSEMLRPKAQ